MDAEPALTVGRPRGRGRLVTSAGRLALGWAFVLALTAAWQELGSHHAVYWLPPFTTVLSRVGNLMSGSNLSNDVLPSAGRAAGGYVIGCAAGLVVGVLIGSNRALDPWVRPVLEFFRALPVPIVVSLGLLMFGFSSTTRIGVIAFGCFWPVVVNADDGARRIDQQLIDTARIAGASRPTILRRVVLPASMPQAVAGLRFAVSIALILMVISELIGASSGLGYYIQNAENTFAYGDAWAAVVVLGIIGWAATVVFALVERRLLRWHIESQEGNRV